MKLDPKTVNFIGNLFVLYGIARYNPISTGRLSTREAIFMMVFASIFFGGCVATTLDNKEAGGFQEANSTKNISNERENG